MVNTAFGGRFFLVMTVLQKITNSKDTAVFTLHREGIFYKCYNEDAMLFYKRVKAFKITCKFVKRAGSMVLSLGFPVTLIENKSLTIDGIAEMVGAASWIEEPHGLIFQLCEDIKMGYDGFQEAITQANQPIKSLQSKTNDEGYQKLIKKIRNYDLANHTPMQGMAFIQELKDVVMKNGL